MPELPDIAAYISALESRIVVNDWIMYGSTAPFYCVVHNRR